MKKKLIVAGIFILSIIIGFFREWVFININEQKRVTYFHDTDSHVSASMQWLSKLSFSTLSFMKWPLTLLFTFIFAFITVNVVRIWFADKEKIRIVWITYSLVMVMGVLIYGFGFLIGQPYITYDISRFLAGLAETPALMIILFASFLVMKKN